MSDYSDRMADPTPRTFKVTSTVGNHKTVADLLAWCYEQGLNPNDVWMPTAHLCHEHTETPKEVAERLRRHNESQERHRAYIKERYRELFPDEATT